MSLAEIIVYVGLMALLLVVITNILFTLSRLQRTATYARAVENDAYGAIDRMVREIRDADSVDATATTYDANPGRLTLLSTDSGGASHTTEFYLQGGVLKFKEDGVYVGVITSSTTDINNLVLRQINSTSTGIKIEMQITAGSGQYQKTENFYDSAILRGSY